jgi:PKD repeat protein
MKLRFVQAFAVWSRALSLAGLVLAAGACGDDDESAPKSDFIYDSDERTVTFINLSKGATSYYWEFGDGETSTEENPVHEYPKFGVYTAYLTATGPGGETLSLPDEMTLAKSSDVRIDGDFAEWADIPVSTENGDGSVTKVKVDYDALKIYFYVEGTAAMQGFFDLYLNVDNDFSKGFNTAQYQNAIGAEFLLEGNLAGDHDAILYGFDFSNNNPDLFDFNVESPVADFGSGFVVSSDLKDIPGGGKAMEFSMLRATLTGLSPAGFTYGIQDLLDWSMVGSIPVAGKANSTTQFVDLTK